MVIRSWLNNYSITGSNDWATKAHFYHVLWKIFWHLMMFHYLAVHHSEELLVNILFHNFRKWQIEDVILCWHYFVFLFWFLFPLSWCILDFCRNHCYVFKDFSYSILELSNIFFWWQVFRQFFANGLWKFSIFDVDDSNLYIYRVVVWFSKRLVRLSFQIWCYIKKVYRWYIWCDCYWKSWVFKNFDSFLLHLFYLQPR